VLGEGEIWKGKGVRMWVHLLLLLLLLLWMLEGVVRGIKGEGRVDCDRRGLGLERMVYGSVLARHLRKKEVVCERH
jgi:hypothetical protein